MQVKLAQRDLKELLMLHLEKRRSKVILLL
jgi:hypothetical protein